MKLMILDGNSVINRAFYGVRLLTTKQGEYTNAIYGFLNILDKMRQEEQPDALCVAFDLHGPTFRHEKYDQYKATRHGMPEELAQQMPVMKDVLRAMNVPIYACQGWEADDVIGTVAKRCSGAGWDCVVVTGDRDSLQLVDEHVTVKLVTTKGGQTGSTNYSPAVFREEYGFEPIRLIDLKALMGDSSDNIPGVAGVGPKTATELLLKYGTLDGVYANLTPQNMKGKLYEKLESGRENAYLSYDLATIRLNAPVDFTPGDALVAEPDKAALYALFLRLEFVKLIDKYKLRGAAAPVGAAQAFPSRGRCPSSQTGADEVDSRQGAAFDEALSASGSTSSVTAAPCHLPLKGKALEGKALTAGNAVLLSEAAALLALYGPLTDGLREQGLEQLYYEMDLPLCAVLAKMEVEGVRVDADALHAFDEMLRARIVEAQEEIFRYAGGDFNINSPKQLGEVLFERLGLPAGKKTKTGWSTNAEVLEKLRDKHPIVGRILEYRTLTKLQATYAEGLLKVVCPDGRVRTTFQNTVTATGRLSSTEPNLQNIPVRTELGAEIRKMFVPEPGWVFVDADYSQIELRVLAHMADDKAMQAAFLSGEDVHRVTASQVFGVPLEDVTPQMRRNAKAVNFGIVYGISDFSLAEDIGVSRAEAKNYIENYLNKYHGVRDFMDAVVEQGTRLGYVSTLYGRRRYLPELKDGKYMVREAAKRMAMNSPVQGSAADVIKLAMLRVDKALRDAGLAARLVLQVHDELIVECPEAEAETVAALVTREMEGAAKLAVPLTAEAKTGRSWYEAK